MVQNYTKSFDDGEICSEPHLEAAMGSYVTDLRKSEFAAPRAQHWLDALGDQQAAEVVGGPERPLSLWARRLGPGAELRWRAPRQDHLLYVWDGAIETEDGLVERDNAVVFEHGSQGWARVRHAAVVLHFHRPEDAAEPAAKVGGRSHGAAPRTGSDPGIPQMTHVLYADSACPTCDVWLHATLLAGAFAFSHHLHSEDEIIVVRRGELVLGRARYGRGTVLAIDAETQYGFAAGERGLEFVNFRPSHPFFIRASEPDRRVDEQAYLLSAVR
jgi:hypothetical protein